MGKIPRALAPPALATALLLCSGEPADASQDVASTTGALKHLSIEELMDIEVTSVSRAPETLSSAAAAVSVITNEDIRRSGATTVPEALRGVPGLHVARRNSNSWAVSSRAFSSINSEKLLVLSDTRSIYTPLVSGVFWDVQDYLLEDVERIEVIRGPGASLWGTNAVNGVINLTTKHARNTQGMFLSAAVGTEELGSAAARYGGKLQTVLDRRNEGQPILRSYYGSSFVKQYEKGDRLLRTETCINNTYDLGIGRRLENLPTLHERMRTTNTRYLEAQADLLASTVEAMS